VCCGRGHKRARRMAWNLRGVTGRATEAGRCRLLTRKPARSARAAKGRAAEREAPPHPYQRKHNLAPAGQRRNANPRRPGRLVRAQNSSDAGAAKLIRDLASQFL